jgi:hypothetical protein
MFSNPTFRSLERCEIYIGMLLLLVSVAFTIPPMLSLFGIPMEMNLAVSMMTFGLEGLFYVSILGFLSLPFLH